MARCEYCQKEMTAGGTCCPACRGQLISCGCVVDENEAEFPTRLELPDAPVWAPLEAVARLARNRDDLPSFHEGEFMYMASVHDDRRTIHLYKHIDTRRYLNLDDEGTAYAFCGSNGDGRDGEEASGGWYVRHRTLADAIARLELELCAAKGLYRSFPPSDWPPDEGGRVRALRDGQAAARPTQRLTGRRRPRRRGRR